LFISNCIHTPHPDKEGDLVESMHRYGKAARTQKGLIDVFTLKNAEGGELVGLALWDSEESYLAARPALRKAVEGDDFDSWEPAPPKGYWLKPV